MQKFLFAPWWNFYRLSFQEALIQGLCFWGAFVIILIIVSYYLYIKTFQKQGKQEVVIDLNINDNSEHANQDSIIQYRLDQIQPQFTPKEFWIMVGCDILIVVFIQFIVIFIVFVGYQGLKNIFQFYLISAIVIGIFLPTIFFFYRINHYYIPYKISEVPIQNNFPYQQANRIIKKRYKKTKQQYQTIYTFIAWLVYGFIFFALTLNSKNRCIIELPQFLFIFEKFDDRCQATYATLGQQDSILKQINLNIAQDSINKKYLFEFPESQNDSIYQYFYESPSDDQSLKIGNFFLPQNFTYTNASVQQSDLTIYNYSNIYDIENLKISVITNSKNFSSSQEQKLIILAGNNIQDFGQTQCSKSIMNSFNNSCKNNKLDYIPLQTYISVPGPLDTGSYWNYESDNLQQIFTNSINLEDYNTLQSSDKQKIKYNITNLMLIGQNVSISYIQMNWVKADNISQNLYLSKNTKNILISPIAVTNCEDNNDYQDPVDRQIIQKYLIQQKQLGVNIILVIESSQTQLREYYYEDIHIAGGGQNDFKYDNLGGCRSVSENKDKQNTTIKVNQKKFYFQFQIIDSRPDIQIEFLDF